MLEFIIQNLLGLARINYYPHHYVYTCVCIFIIEENTQYVGPWQYVGIKKIKCHATVVLAGGVHVIPFQSTTIVFLLENHSFGKKIISRLVQSGQSPWGQKSYFFEQIKKKKKSNKSEYKSWVMQNLKPQCNLMQDIVYYYLKKVQWHECY